MPNPVFEIYIGEVRGDVYGCPSPGEVITFLPEEIANETGMTV